MANRYRFGRYTHNADANKMVFDGKLKWFVAPLLSDTRHIPTKHILTTITVSWLHGLFVWYLTISNFSISRNIFSQFFQPISQPYERELYQMTLHGVHRCLDWAFETESNNPGNVVHSSESQIDSINGTYCKPYQMVVRRMINSK